MSPGERPQEELTLPRPRSWKISIVVQAAQPARGPLSRQTQQTGVMSLSFFLAKDPLGGLRLTLNPSQNNTYM